FRRSRAERGRPEASRGARWRQQWVICRVIYPSKGGEHLPLRGSARRSWATGGLRTYLHNRSSPAPAGPCPRRSAELQGAVGALGEHPVEEQAMDVRLAYVLGSAARGALRRRARRRRDRRAPAPARPRRTSRSGGTACAAPVIVEDGLGCKRLDSAGGAVLGCAMRTSRAVVQTAPRRLELRELPVPDIDDDSALLRVEACGICGSDAEQYAGVLPVRLPVVPGHEPLGVIERIGDRAA